VNGCRRTAQISQLLQLLALQPEQGFPPTGEEVPVLSLEKQANLDNAGSTRIWQRGQGALTPARLIGRSSSNLVLHSGQIYSYIGISISPGVILACGKTEVNAEPPDL